MVDSGKRSLGPCEYQFQYGTDEAGRATGTLTLWVEDADTDILLGTRSPITYNAQSQHSTPTKRVYTFTVEHSGDYGLVEPLPLNVNNTVYKGDDALVFPTAHVVDLQRAFARDDVEAAVNIADAVYGGRNLLDALDDLRAVISADAHLLACNAFASTDFVVEDWLFRRRHAYFTDQLGDTITTIDRLRDLVTQYNDLPTLGTVTVADIIGEYLADKTPTLALDDLENFGLTLADTAPQFDAPGTYILAHCILSEDAEYARQRIFDAHGYLDSLNYEHEKDSIGDNRNWHNAGYLLPYAAQHGLREFKYVLMNYLHWSASHTSTYARAPHILQQAAYQLGKDLDIPDVWQRAECEMHINRGHDLRRRRSFTRAQTEFTNAREKAQRLNRPWKEVHATANEAMMKASQHRDDNDYAAAADALTEGITALTNISRLKNPASCDEYHLLHGKLNENRFEHARRNDDETKAVKALGRALTYYEEADVSRSVDRVERKFECFLN